MIDFVLEGSDYLSLLAVDDVIKDALPQTIEHLSDLGVRFVYYSPYNYMHSRKLASRMGLETGWNTAISLADECVGERLEWEDFAQLPHGIQQIRTQLETQDNVPLLVHLFTHSYSLFVIPNRSTDDHMLGMLDVMTEWGEGVMTLSNSSHTANAQLFKKVDVARTLHLGPLLHHNEPVRPLLGDA